MDVHVQDVPAQQRYEGREGGPDGPLVGIAAYRLSPDGVMIFTHTEVPPRLGGRGIAGRIIGHALDDVRTRDLRAVPACSYVVDYVRKNPEYADLLSRP